MDAYGNGLDYIIVLPDNVAEELPVLYSLYAAITESPINNSQLQKIVNQADDLMLISRNSIIVDGETGETGMGSLILEDDKDFLLGKWALKESYFGIYSVMISLVYIAFIFVITGLGILATQLLSDSIKNKYQYKMLQNLGMKHEYVNKLINKQLFYVFFFPNLPAFIISVSLVYILAQKIHSSLYSLPIYFENIWIVSSIMEAAAIFMFFYILYFFIVCKSYKKAVIYIDSSRYL